jgi:hypothetical protein
LPGNTHTALGKVLALQREAGQPVMLTLRQLRCHDEALPAGPVRVCENPVVIAAAADELGSRCTPRRTHRGGTVPRHLARGPDLTEAVKVPAWPCREFPEWHLDTVFRAS